MDEVKIITALLSDIQLQHSSVYTPREKRLDDREVVHRFSREGISFLTKTLPRLGKALDRALSGEVIFDAIGFQKKPNSKIPRFLGSLFECIFSHDGWVLPEPSVTCIAAARQLLYLFYKYELPYAPKNEQEVIDGFKQTEDDLLSASAQFSKIAREADSHIPISHQDILGGYSDVVVKARELLSKVFTNFDPRDIIPSHGPGAVSTREKLWDKWSFRTISDRITDVFPADEYYFASVGHVCDAGYDLNDHSQAENFARVVLVPKDSRGPRLISCEPLEFQWIQQGIRDSIYKWVERHPLTRDNVRFTDQEPNRFAALYGSLSGKYATLDLKEASDRVTLGLVQLLFPHHVLRAVEASRSLATELPSGEYVTLTKFAPMGSALCFPIMALTIWSLLTAATSDTDTRESIYVYGDDVIVPTAYAMNAIEVLEVFGLKVNRTKSFTKGFFRESCGLDAYRGVDVTPLKIKRVWSSLPCPHVYSAWISYANTLFDKHYYCAYWYIVDELLRVYRRIPERSPEIGVPALALVSPSHRPNKTRTNPFLQKKEVKMWTIVPTSVDREIDGWAMLLRYFTEGRRARTSRERENGNTQCSGASSDAGFAPAFGVRRYTERGAVKLAQRWQ